MQICLRRVTIWRLGALQWVGFVTLCIHQIPRAAKVSANQLKLSTPAKGVDTVLAAAGEIPIGGAALTLLWDQGVRIRISTGGWPHALAAWGKAIPRPHSRPQLRA